MEEVRVLLVEDFDQDVNLGPAPHPEQERFTLERRSLFVPDSEGVMAGSIKEVVVTVSWEEGSGRTGEFQLLERFRRP